MGSRGRSIRLTIYFLVAIPLITMMGLFAYVAYTSVTNFQNLDRAPGLIKATSEPITRFVSLLQAERRAAVVYLSRPDAANGNAYQASVMATKAGELPLEAALDSPGTKSSANAQETAAITRWAGEINGMTRLRAGVTGKELAPLAAFAAYTKIITDQDSVFQAEAASMIDTIASSQGLGLISTVNAREDLDEQDAVLAGALASGTLAPEGRVAFNQAAGRQQDDTALYTALLTPAELGAFNAPLSTPALRALQNQLATAQQAVESGAPLARIEAAGVTAASWQRLTSAIANANFQGGLVAADEDLANVQQLANDAKTRVWLTASIGAAGLILTLVVTAMLGRSINRRLAVLRRTALTLAEEQLPAVVARLRRGESVDIAAEAPPLRVGSDEIGQVGQAIDTVRQTAIRSAVEEARLRQGINDVFRNLARRSQSLLQRQLTVLDGMERRATDPDVLGDLFKLDHLTTRMRRHAEGLIILSGSQPGRSWSAPVRLIDVIRGAIAEVEDYARVTVATQSKAALAGSAVTDVIHLLAELIENATTLSPPFTQVRVSGDTVANGFAIEIEDRGLGMTPARMAELNERLANPPDINPANTEQLGLFVVGQLARRHGIGVTLRPSPFGGTTAVVLIPQRLIVDEGPAAITAGDPWMVPAAAGPEGPGGPGAGPGGPGGLGAGPADGGLAGAGSPGPGTAARSYAAPRESLGGHGNGAPYQGNGAPHQGNGAPHQGLRGRHSAPEVPVVTGVPVSRRSVWPESSFDVFTPLRRSEAGAGGASGGPPAGSPPGPPADSPLGPPAGSPPGSPAGPPVNAPGRSDGAPYALPYPGHGGVPRAQAPHPGGGQEDGHESSSGDHEGSPDGNPGSTGAGDYKGLPRRVRQASLAPQLRSSTIAGSGPTGSGPTGVPPATAASLAVMRNTLSAMQRGWLQGRSESQRETEGSTDGD
jgi:signal transduction histidine kinase